MLIRTADRSDARALSQLLNGVVDEGDKTAIDCHLSEDKFADWFLTGDHCVSCVVAEDNEGRILGFQALERFHQDLPEEMADIATFVSLEARGSGVGRALIDMTIREAERKKVASIRAVIRRTNHNAIRYYRSIDFSQELETELPTSVGLIRPLTR